MTIDIRLFRSWCLQLPETKYVIKNQDEYFQIFGKTFAMINPSGIRLKCAKDDYHQLIQHPDINPSKIYGKKEWIWIHSFNDLYVDDFLEFIINSYEIIVHTLKSEVKKRLLSKLTHDIDSPWKDVIGSLFQDCVEFFAPEIAKDIDWSKSPLFLDKELSQIMRDSKTGRRFVDKLVQIYRLSGEIKWVLFHLEIQGQRQSSFPKRMFTYSNRLEDLYQMLVASFAILVDDHPEWRPSSYRSEIWGTRKSFEFPIIKLLDYKDRWDELEKSTNPFAIVVMAHLKMLETKGNHDNRLHWKIELTRMMHNKRFSPEKGYALFQFIDWIMMLPRELATSYKKKIYKIEEECKMKFLALSSIELIAKEEGREKGLEEGKILGQMDLLNQLKSMKTIAIDQYNQMMQGLKTQLEAISQATQSPQMVTT